MIDVKRIVKFAAIIVGLLCTEPCLRFLQGFLLLSSIPEGTLGRFYNRINLDEQILAKEG
jgi:hypothetical protein